MRLFGLAALALAALTFGIAGAAGAFHRGSNVVTAVPPSPAPAELAAIRQVVLQAASAMGDPSPTDAVLVPTTRRLAELVDVDTAEPDTPVYFVLVHGRFTDPRAPVPQSAQAPPRPEERDGAPGHDPRVEDRLRHESVARHGSRRCDARRECDRDAGAPIPGHEHRSDGGRPLPNRPRASGRAQGPAPLPSRGRCELYRRNPDVPRPGTMVGADSPGRRRQRRRLAEVLRAAERP